MSLPPKPPPSRLLWKAISLPFGDQAGPLLFPAVLVICRSPEPSAFTT